MDYYNFYTILDLRIYKTYSSIYQIEFNHWTENCGKPRRAILKLISKENYKYSYFELNNLLEASSIHSNFLEVYKSFDAEKYVLIIMEMCNYSNLHTLINQIVSKKSDGYGLKEPWNDIQLIYRMKQLAKAVRLLHKKNISHRDIKPGNIFIKSDAQLKLGDLGVAKKIDNMNGYHTYVGTEHFKSPQITKSVEVDKLMPFKDDIWALGVTFFYMGATEKINRKPFSSLPQEEIKWNVESLKRSEHILSIIQECLMIQYSDRIDSKNLYKKIKIAFNEIILQSFSDDFLTQEQYLKLIEYNDRTQDEDFRDIKRLTEVPCNQNCIVCKKLCKPTENDWINYRYVHFVHIKCLLFRYPWYMNQLNCWVCTQLYKETKDLQNSFRCMDGNYFRSVKCSCVYNLHEFVAIDHKFKTRMYECIKNNTKLCSMCNKSEAHEHCIGFEVFYESNLNNNIIYCSERTEIYRSIYKNDPILLLENPELPSEFIIKKTKAMSIKPSSIHLHYIAYSLCKKIIKLHYWFTKSDEIYLCMDYVPGKTLYQEILYRRKNSKQFTEQEVRNAIEDLADIKMNLHDNYIYHNDISVKNLYITQDYRFRLGNFSESCLETERNWGLEQKDNFAIAGIIEKMLGPSLCKNQLIKSFVDLCCYADPGTDFNSEYQYKMGIN